MSDHVKWFMSLEEADGGVENLQTNSVLIREGIL